MPVDERVSIIMLIINNKESSVVQHLETIDIHIIKTIILINNNNLKVKVAKNTIKKETEQK